MIIILWIILIVAGLLFPKSKYLSYTQMIFIILTMGLSTGTADYDIYNKMFDSVLSNPKLIFSGSGLLYSIFYICGKILNYQSAIFIIALVGTILIYKAIYFYTKSTSLILSAYLIAPFVIDATQLKNFLAMTIWLYFSRYLYLAFINQNKKQLRNILLYLVGVMISSYIHIAFLATALFVIIPYIKIKSLLIVSVCMNTLFLSLKSFNLLELIMKKISSLNGSIFNIIYIKYVAYKIAFQADATNARLYLTIGFTVILLICILVIFILKIIKYENNIMMNFMIALNVTFLFLLPLFFFSMEFYRIQRNMLIIDYIALSNGMTSSSFRKKIKVTNIVIGVLILIIAYYYLYIDAIIWNYDTVFVPLFKL